MKNKKKKRKKTGTEKYTLSQHTCEVHKKFQSEICMHGRKRDGNNILYTLLCVMHRGNEYMMEATTTRNKERRKKKKRHTRSERANSE